jgi:putative FmdB family regulatory protein
MPIYEFRCSSCGEQFEAYCSLSERHEGLTCPRCGQQRLERILSSFSTRVGGGGPAPAGKSCSRFS